MDVRTGLFYLFSVVLLFAAGLVTLGFRLALQPARQPLHTLPHGGGLSDRGMTR